MQQLNNYASDDFLIDVLKVICVIPILKDPQEYNLHIIRRANYQGKYSNIEYGSIKYGTWVTIDLCFQTGMEDGDYVAVFQQVLLPVAYEVRTALRWIAWTLDEVFV